ncbi:MAG: hypothetical protein ACOYOK_13795 [Pseudobdellovibrionaceae bacterium]
MAQNDDSLIFAQILACLSPQGAALRELGQRLGSQVSKRTLQRALNGPFEDVNKRVSRLSANIPLLRHNLCPLTFLDVPERAYVDGYLAVYELNRIEILRDVFVWAYERSVREYLAVRKTLTPPDPLRLKYREPLHALIHQIVMENTSKPLTMIKRAAATLPREHRAAFTDLVLDDLKRLHEGVLARYQISTAAFDRWQKKNHK